MNSSVLYLVLLCIYNSILFFGRTLGLNVLLFNIPVLLFIYHVLNKNKKIINKNGLLFIIPIALLSLSFVIYDNEDFEYLNVIAITGMFILMYVYSFKNYTKFSNLFIDCLRVGFKSLNYVGEFIYSIEDDFGKIPKKPKKNNPKFKSLIIVIPIVIVVLVLLSSADMLFGSIFKTIYDNTLYKIPNLFENIKIWDIVARVFFIVLLFIYMGGTLKYLISDYKEDSDSDEGRKYKLDKFTLKLLLTTLNVVYIIFDFIQIRSLMFHHGLGTINYAQYARTGFFQLMFISFINIVILLISKMSDKDNKYNNIMSIVMIFLTLIIIISSFYRMHLYEAAYGYTILRLLVFVALITETIMLVPTFMYVINSKINILNTYVITVTTMYTLLALFPSNYFIASNNIKRFHKTGKIDVYYLMNNSSDNIPLLFDLYIELKDREDIEDYELQKGTHLNFYLGDILKTLENRTIFEYSISGDIAYEKIKMYKKELH